MAWHESGHDNRARLRAADVLARRPVVAPEPGKFELSGGTFAILNYDYLVGAARGALAPDAWAREHDNAKSWLEKKVGESAANVWLHLDALAASTRAQAEAALAAAPPGVSPATPLDWALLGHVYALGERWDDALLPLERATHGCFEFIDVPFYIRAHIELGRTYEAKGDLQHACEQYGQIVARWGGARPRSVTAEAARARLGALRCPP